MASLPTKSFIQLTNMYWAPTMRQTLYRPDTSVNKTKIPALKDWLLSGIRWTRENQHNWDKLCKFQSPRIWVWSAGFTREAPKWRVNKRSGVPPSAIHFEFTRFQSEGLLLFSFYTAFYFYFMICKMFTLLAVLNKVSPPPPSPQPFFLLLLKSHFY